MTDDSLSGWYREELIAKVVSGVPVIQIVSSEWDRIIGLSVEVGRQTRKSHDSPPRRLFAWNSSQGLNSWDYDKRDFNSVDSDKRTPGDVLKWYSTEPETEGSILLLEDLHMHFDNAQEYPEILSFLRTIPRRRQGKTILLAQPFRRLPPELDKLVYIVDVPLPDRKVLATILERRVLPDFKIESGMGEEADRQKVIEAALGLTIHEAEYAFREAIQRTRSVTASEAESIVAYKEQVIKKSGILEYFHPQVGLEAIGGLEQLKEWLQVRRNGFDENARRFGMTPPKGVLLIGIQGCGKSLTAKAIASAWKLPLLRFDVGKVFGGVVGESEANIRRALDVARAVAPSVLWIDEIEKGFGGVSSSDRLDAGTTARVFGTMLTWMQEKEEAVFVIATANDIEKLPPELLRKGRFDEIFFVDLPGPKSREKIWEIHLRRRLGKRYEGNGLIFNLSALASASTGYSGAEIEETINEGLYRAYAAHRELSMDDLTAALHATYPLSKVKADTVSKLREWAKVRARLASLESVEPMQNDGKSVPRLRQEADNPFV